MKRLLIAFIMSVSTITGIYAQDAVYVYRNDGEFDAFLTEDVDSILFFTVPVDSMGNPEYPLYTDSTAHYSRRAPGSNDGMSVQAVYTRDGGVHYIPMNAIDSIGFTPPPAIFADNVKVMEESMWKYITAVEGKRLYFAATLPTDMLPKMNDILLCTDIDSPYFREGFVGKVTRVAPATGGTHIVDCSNVDNIDEIFKQLIGIERVTDDSTPQNASTRASGDVDLGEIDVEIGLEISQADANSKISVGGKVNGRVIGTVVYNISKKTKKIDLRLKHDWQASAKIESSLFGEYEYISKGKELFTTYFPWWCPIFKFGISAHMFAHADGKATVSNTVRGPKYSYDTKITYLNGKFDAINQKINNGSDNVTATFAAAELESSLHVGGMARMTLGTIDCFDTYIRATTDFYVGPKISGKFSFDTEKVGDKGYYRQIKDEKIELDLLAIDIKAYGEAQLSKLEKYTGEFCNIKLAALKKEWFMLPELSEPYVTLNGNTATVSCTPKRQLVMPLMLGYALYDEETNTHWSGAYDSKYYSGGEGFTLTQEFSQLNYGTTYTVYPMIRYMGYDLLAEPTAQFTTPESTKPLCPNHNHPHMIDLGLPSGMQWACCNVGAEQPEAYGGYYAWAETWEKTTYTWDNYKYFTPPPPPSTDYPRPQKGYYQTDIQHNIEGTEYDVAHTTWGNGWRMPTSDEYKELEQNCTWTWDTYNGIKGMMVTGKNGNRIFLPAAGYSRAYQGDLGYYRFGTFLTKFVGQNSLYRIKANEHKISSIESPSGCSVRAVK